MLRREWLRTAATAGAVATAGCLDGLGSPSFDEGFEDGLGEWDSGATADPEDEVFEWQLGVTETEAATGDRSLRIWNEGEHGDGVTWVVHPVPVDAERAYDVTVTAQFWSESESADMIRDAVLRLGPEPPAVEGDFPAPGGNTTGVGETPYGGLREPLWLAEGWREYRFEWTTPELSTDTLSLAVGHAVVRKRDAAHFVDDISVEFSER